MFGLTGRAVVIADNFLGVCFAKSGFLAVACISDKD